MISVDQVDQDADDALFQPHVRRRVVPYGRQILGERTERGHARLEKLGVVSKTPTTQAGPVTIAMFDDTCGNLIQIVQL